MSHDQQPRVNHQEDMSADELAFRHAAPSHERPNNNRRNLLIGGGALTGIAGLITAGVFTLGGGGDKKPAERSDVQEPGTSQVAEPTPTVDIQPTQEPTATAEGSTVPDVIDDAYIESITRNPPEEAIKYALEPISVDEYTADEAAIRQMNNLKILFISGKSAWKGGPDNLTETPESTAQRETLLTSILGEPSGRIKDLQRLPIDWMLRVRGTLAKQLEFVSIEDGGYEEDSTFNSTAKILKHIPDTDDDPTTESYRIRNTWKSNIQELDPTFDTGPSWPLSVTDRTITMKQVDGRWVVSELKEFDLIKDGDLKAFEEE